MASEATEAPEAKDSSEAAARRAGLNNKPAWMSRGIGVNKEFFGEVKGDLMKPGLTKADLERLEKTKPSGPDPFGDVFRENVKLEDKKEAAASATAPAEPAASPDAAEAKAEAKAKVTPPWRRSEEAPAPPPGTLGKAALSAPPPGTMGKAAAQGKSPGAPPYKAAAGASVKAGLVKAPAMAAASAKQPAMAAASAKAPSMAAASAKQLPAHPPAGAEDTGRDPEEDEEGEDYDPFTTAPDDSPAAAGAGEELEEVDAWKAPASTGDVQTVPAAAAFKGVAAKAFLSGTAAKRPMPFKAPPPKAMDVPDFLTGLIAQAQAESAQTLESIRAMSKQLAAQQNQPPPLPPGPPKVVPGKRRPGAPADGDRVVRAKSAALPKAVKEENKSSEKGQKKPAASEAEVAAASWLAQGGTGPRRLDKAAALAEEYFAGKNDEAVPAAKRPKVAGASSAEKAAGKGKPSAAAAAPVVNFAPELLEKAPSSIQTCRSLLLFLDKKLEAPLEPAPAVSGPVDLRARLEKQAEGLGRVAGLRETGGWDSRAKRIINIVSAVSSTAGGAALKAFEKQLEENAAKLEKELKDRKADGLQSLLEKRRAWARDCIRREWLVWCGRLLRVQEAALLKAAEGGEDGQAAKKDGVGFVGVIEALLTGEGGLSPSCAGG
mmetsp:Transcript_6836/g.12725  ORF Transcript_6836/g.12725 Transcript_6836/m.12725 type:complete len:660 (-) Transcript_6836:85-2064(-)